MDYRYDRPITATTPAKRPEQNYRIEVSAPVLFGGADHDPVGLDLSPDLPDYVTPDGVEVWIERKHQKTRFLDARGVQVGPVHRNLAPAITWARVQGWSDPSLPDWFNAGAIAEAHSGGCQTPGTTPRRVHEAMKDTGFPVVSPGEIEAEVAADVHRLGLDRKPGRSQR